MFRPLVLVLGIAAALGAAQAADSTATTSRHRDHFAQLDTNGDGKISEEEFLAAAAQRFDAMDTRHRGLLDSTDLATAPDVIARDDRRAAGLTKDLDTNGDGKVDAAELAAGNDRLFARLDKNGDGLIGTDEFDSARPEGKHGRFGEYAAKRLAALDTNHDGKVTRAEFDAGAAARLAETDADHDGALSANEMADSPRTLERNARFAEAMVKRMDSNGDNQVSRDEYLAAAKARFARMDGNNDGVLDQSDRHARRVAERADKE